MTTSTTRSLQELVQTYDIEELEATLTADEGVIVSYFANGDFDLEQHDAELNLAVETVLRNEGTYDSSEGTVTGFQVSIELVGDQFVINGKQVIKTA